ncbi:aminotransferase class I/II-fold pyridoxal phosphate-dependent enzyme, partial [Frankia casuarinae]
GRTLRGRIPTTSADLCQLILEEAGVAIVPGEAFGTPGFARLSYALSDDDLVKGVSRLSALLAEAA